MTERTAAVATILGLALLTAGCGTTYKRGEPLGKKFPTVRGNSLDGTAVTLPDDYAGRELILLIGYEMDTQFDLDRWLLGFQQMGTDVDILEVPTIPGLIPGLFASRIDAGMRSGIPASDWAVVVTVYDDGDIIAEFLGNENSLPGRVVLLDREGKVAFFHDAGFSVGSLIKLRYELARIREAGSSTPDGSTPDGGDPE